MPAHFLDEETEAQDPQQSNDKTQQPLSQMDHQSCREFISLKGN